MSAQNKSIEPAQAQPAVSPAVAPTSSQAVSPPAAATPAASQDAPPWLPDRLEQARSAERNRLLKELGFGTVDEGKQLIQSARELTDAQLSENERLKKQLDELRPQAEERQKFQSLFASQVEQQFGNLTAEQQAAVDLVAKEDPVKRWELMQFANTFGGAKAAAPPVAAPANTTPPGTPAPPAPVTPKTKYQQYQELKARDPVHGAVFYQLHAAAIAASKPVDN